MNIDFILSQEPFASDTQLSQLLRDIIKLRESLNCLTLEKYKRINPFVENLIDWKKKGDLLFGEGKNITVYDTSSIVGDVEVGENTWIGPYTALDGTGGLKIGRNCSISAGVNIVTHDSVKWALSGGKHSYEFAPINIGDNCFIGTGAFITKGVSIGDSCLIGAGAVVTHDLPARSIAMGVPARIKGRVLIDESGEIRFEYLK